MARGRIAGPSRDYEKSRGGGQAYFRLLEFLPDRKTVQVRTYSPALKRSRRSELEEFRFELQHATRSTPRPDDEPSSAKLTSFKPERSREPRVYDYPLEPAEVPGSFRSGPETLDVAGTKDD